MSHRLVAGLLHAPLVTLREDATGDARAGRPRPVRPLGGGASRDPHSSASAPAAATLALVQARWVAARLAEHGVATEITIIRTEGDDRPVRHGLGRGRLRRPHRGGPARRLRGPRGALREGRPHRRARPARHRRLPAPRGSARRARLPRPRDDARDAAGRAPASARTARAGSPSCGPSDRTSTLHPLHGNVDTRLAKLDRGDSDALVLAVAGLTRLGRADRIDDVLPSELVAVRARPGLAGAAGARRRRRGDRRPSGLLDDPDTRVAVEAERALLTGTGGGCRSPIGVVGTVRDGRLDAGRRRGARRGCRCRRRHDPRAARGLGPRQRAPSADRAHLAVRLARADRGAAGPAPGARRAARRAGRRR